MKSIYIKKYVVVNFVLVFPYELLDIKTCEKRKNKKVFDTLKLLLIIINECYINISHYMHIINKMHYFSVLTEMIVTTCKALNIVYKLLKNCLV